MSDNESSSSDDYSSSEEIEKDVVTEQERLNIRNKLSNMSFEDLQKLKNNIGAKLYNETVFASGDDEDKKTNKLNSKTKFKRANKNRPRQMSSKLRYNRHNNQPNSIPTTKIEPCRDPRFDPLCGSFDKKLFQNNYKFITDLKKKEKVALEKEYKETTDLDRQQQIKLLIQRIDNQIREEERRGKEDQEKFEERKELKEKLKRGEKPQFKKKSVQKFEKLIDKYEQLKKTNKLQKHIEKKTKKLEVKNKINLKKQNLI